MYKASRSLASITNEQLDQYLSKGWFRMHQSIFTCEFWQEGFNFRDTIWLRQRLADFQLPNWFHKMERKYAIRVAFSDFILTQEQELLYQSYYDTKPKEFPASLESILYGDGCENIYDTKMVNLYFSEQLVGAGFFDMGKTSAAAIVTCYDPGFSSISLGRFINLNIIKHLKEKGLDYFYPGYFAPGNSRFDYKLQFHQPSLEYYQSANDQWIPFRHYYETSLPLTRMKEKLLILSSSLESAGFACCFLINYYFALEQTSKYDSPYVMYILPLSSADQQYAITYDTNKNKYQVFNCTEMDCADFIHEEGDQLVCLQFMHLKTPIGRAYNPGEVVEKIIDLNLEFRKNN